MITLIIISQNRAYHLQRLLDGVSKNTRQPDQIVIVSNDTDPSSLPPLLPIEIIKSPYKDFPIGENRNLGAAYASHPYLFFLDVDCIPAQDYFETLYDDLLAFGGLCMGNPKYLSRRVPKDFTFKLLQDDGIYHPHRPQVLHTQKEKDYALFWSLCFAISKENFDRIGGFDTAYIGYGAEDTDFGFKAEKYKIPFTLSTAEAYHQQHPVFRPPVNHLQDIVYNSNVFHKKWGKWPMGGWLQEFVDKGWITWDNDSIASIEIINCPSEQAVASYKVEDARFV